MQFDLLKTGTEIIAGASLLHTFLPPWEAFNDYPSIQKPYKLIVYIVGYVALNGRSTIYPALSTKSGTQVAPIVDKVNGGHPNGA